jgi:N-acetylmuramoyl-L-alanine amidase
MNPNPAPPNPEMWPFATAANPTNSALGWGDVIADVRTITVHATAGWPRRERVNEFVKQYLVDGVPKRGIGPQFHIAGDGTVFRIIDLPRTTWHAEWTNGWSVGSETGNPLDSDDIPPPPGHGWIAVTNKDTDLPGLKLHLTPRGAVHEEVVALWFTTDAYTGGARLPLARSMPLFTEQQMQAWALLARYLTSEFGVPRNFPLLPHLSRRNMIGEDNVAANAAANAARAATFRRLVLADESAEMTQRRVAAAPINIPAASFDAANAAALVGQYLHPIVAEHPAPPRLQRHNRAYQAWTEHFRGIVSHRLVGSIKYGLNAAGNMAPHAEHDCPGAMYDFHRLAREISDYWWFPFDILAGTTAAPPRPYRAFDATTPLLEYYWDESEADRLARVVVGPHGPSGSPDSFRMDPASPVYAMSHGELIAARFVTGSPGISVSFLLVRHEVYHHTYFQSVFDVPVLPLPEIDYTQAPETVYSLYMHLGTPTGMTLATTSDSNPDWLNRLVMRKKECDRGIDFYDGDPQHGNIPAALWNNRPPGVPQRPTTLEGWRLDARVLGDFLAALGTGDVAVMPRTGVGVPVRILQGDYLGDSGAMGVNAAGTAQTGVRVEVFAPTFDAPGFSLIGSLAGWNPLPTTPQCVQYHSEWARLPNAPETLTFAGAGVTAAQLQWWPQVARAQALEASLVAGERLPPNGIVFHYRPLEFAAWINDVTWSSEWPKFKITDAAGNAVARPARPRPRRV